MEITHSVIMKILNDYRTGTTVLHSFITNMARAGYIPTIRQEGEGTRSTRYYNFSHLLYIFALSQLTKLIDVKRLVQIPAKETRKDLAISVGEYLAGLMARIQDIAVPIFREAIKARGKLLTQEDIKGLMETVEKQLVTEEKRIKPILLYEGLRFQLNRERSDTQFYKVEFFREQESKKAAPSKLIRTIPVNHYQDVDFRIYYTDPSGSRYRRPDHAGALKGGETGTDTPWWMQYSPVTEYHFVKAASGLFWVLAEYLENKK